jgi:hypothetical protein
MSLAISKRDNFVKFSVYGTCMFHKARSGMFSDCSNIGIWLLVKISLQKPLCQEVKCHNTKSTCSDKDSASFAKCTAVDVIKLTVCSGEEIQNRHFYIKITNMHDFDHQL